MNSAGNTMNPNKDKKIILLAGKGFSTNVVYHRLNESFGLSQVIVENRESAKRFFARRFKKLGFWEVAGQLLFLVFVNPILRKESARAVEKIKESEGLNEAPIESARIVNVDSINNSRVAELITSINPDLVVVNGTRIISKKILALINCPVVNMHAGITPTYRGVHGGYWALTKNDAENCGVTVHLVDAGVDTGEVLYQAKITVQSTDNFNSYPVKQLAAGIPLMIQAAHDVFAGRLRPYAVNGNSCQWYHPTIWTYLYFRIFKGIK